jgi:hypothetical protein
LLVERNPEECSNEAYTDLLCDVGSYPIMLLYYFYIYSSNNVTYHLCSTVFTIIISTIN